MNFRRGVLAGIAFGLAGLVGPPLVIGAVTGVAWWLNGTPRFDRRWDILWWWDRAFPGIVVIPLLLFFTGLATYTPQRYFGFAKTLLILAVTSLPLSAFLGVAGWAHPRVKSIEHPPMYLSEVLMFVIPMAAVALILLEYRRPRAARRLGDHNARA